MPILRLTGGKLKERVRTPQTEQSVRNLMRLGPQVQAEVGSPFMGSYPTATDAGYPELGDEVWGLPGTEFEGTDTERRFVETQIARAAVIRKSQSQFNRTKHQKKKVKA